MKRLRLLFFPLVVALCAGVDAAPAACQSLNLNTPAAVHEGNNQALIDSFVGDHYYFFYAEPGRFHIAWTWGNASEGFNVGGKPSFAAAFNPKTQGSVMTFKEGPNGTTYDGTVTQRTRVLIGVSPVNSKLVRQTTPYNLVVTGNVSFANAAGGPDPIVGLYAQKLLFQGEPELGAVKFLTNGTIVTSNGGEGNWKLFDADSGVYSVTIGGRRMTLTLQRGRALVDTASKSTVFELQH
ncbi:hypothetical protein [Tunturiibacter lichenicola]|uniref:hypothetical protein n=1 Tax=Tunturiibacter lichenicola TaxID=2051959 RepID=UPI0021B3FE75|nr:hypothetical protein [Edaphobacter lichenicola]